MGHDINITIGPLKARFVAKGYSQYISVLKTINSRMVRFFGPTPILVVKFLSRFICCEKQCLR